MDSFRKSVISSVRGVTPHLPKGQLLAIDLWYDQLPRSTIQSVSKQQHCNKGEDFRYLYITTQITHIYRHMWKQRWDVVGSTDFGRASLSSSHRHGNHPPALVTAVKAYKKTRGWRFSRPVHTHFLPQCTTELQQQTRPRDDFDS